MAVRRKKLSPEAERVLTPTPEQVEKAIPAVEDAPAVEAVKETLEAIRVKRTRTVKAIKSDRGLYGRTKFDLVAGKHYTFPVEVADYLARTGRVIG